MSLANALSNLSVQARAAILAVIVFPIVVVASYLYMPSLAAPVLVGATIVMAVAIEYLARAVHRERADDTLRRILGFVTVISVLVIAGTGVAILRAGGAPWDLLAIGAVVGALVGGLILVAAVFAEERPRVSLGIVALVFVIAVVAAARAVGHLGGIAPQGAQATVAASGFLGLFVVLGLFGAREIL